MSKLLWWSLREYVQKYLWLYLSLAAVMLLAAVVPAKTGYLSAGVHVLCSVFGAFFLVYTLIQSVSVTTRFLWAGTAPLELSLPVRGWKLLASKLALSALILVAGVLLTRLLGNMLTKFGGSALSFGTLKNCMLYTAAFYVLVSVILLVTIAAGSIPLLRNASQLALALCAVGICLLLLLLVLVVLFNTLAGNRSVTIESPQTLNLAVNASRRWLTTALEIILPIVTFVACFAGSCVLLERKFERYNNVSA